MASIKRYAPHIALFGNPIFRAIKVTNQNHRTVKLFARDHVSFKTVEVANKSIRTTKELVIARTMKNRSASARNGDYIARDYDGSFKLIRAVEFERSYQETHIRIADLKQEK